MSELTDLLILIGFENNGKTAVENNGGSQNANYLLNGDRILSLAREKKRRPVRDLTVGLCDFNFPKLTDEHNKNCMKISQTIKKALKTITAKESLVSEGIPFLLRFFADCPDWHITEAAKSLKSNLARQVGKSESIIELAIGPNTFYVPCENRKKFQDADYHYNSHPDQKIHMVHADKAFFYIFFIHWLNQLKLKSRTDLVMSNALKHFVQDTARPLLRWRWESFGLPDWFVSYLLDCGFYLDGKQNYYTSAHLAEKAETKIYEEMRDLSASIKLVSLAYGNSLLSALDLIKQSENSVFLSIPYDYEKCAYLTLSYFISNAQDSKREILRQKKMEGMAARAYMTKRHIPQHILKAMQDSTLNSHFGFIEFDEETDLERVEAITQEFHKLNHLFFHGFTSKQIALRFRKLGRHHATGAYYPSLNTMVVDFRYPDSFVHEYFHMFDDICDNLSTQCHFNGVIAQYRLLVQDILHAKAEKGNHMLSIKGKYNPDYYLSKSEIFARCGEIHLFRNLHVVSSLLKPEETQSFAYPDDPLLNRLIYDYYNSLLKNLKSFAGRVGKERHETDLRVPIQ